MVAARSLGAGLLMALALPPWGWWPLAFGGVWLLDRTIADAPAWSRFHRGWLVGLALLGPSLWWMQSLTLPGYVIAVGFFSVMLGAGLALCPPAGLARWVALPGAIVLVDAARSRWPFGGVPLSTLAHSQVAGPLAPAARVGGALLLVMVAAAAGVALAAAARRAWRPAVLALAGVVVVVVAGAAAPDGRAVGSVRVAVVQGGGPQGTRADRTDERVVFDRHMAASEDVDGPVDLVLWPEDVVDIAGPIADAPEGDELAALARRLDATLVVGTVEDATVDGRDRFHNNAVAFGPDGAIVDIYEKVRRVPFGEYVPFRSLLERIAGDDLIDSEALVGDGPPVLQTPAGRFGVLISWEVFFSDRGRAAVGDDEGVLLNPTNGASFTGTLVQSQQIAASRLRAIESGRWVVQAAPTGFSAVITEDGDVLQRSGVSERRVLHDTVDVRSGRTVADRVGDWPALVLALGLVAAGWLLDRRTRAPAGS